MLPQQWVLFIVGISLIILGAWLIAWGVMQKKAHAGVVRGTATLIEKIIQLIGALGKFLGPDPAIRAGAFLILVGIALNIGILFVPGARG